MRSRIIPLVIQHSQNLKKRGKGRPPAESAALVQKNVRLQPSEWVEIEREIEEQRKRTGFEVTMAGLIRKYVREGLARDRMLRTGGGTI